MVHVQRRAYGTQNIRMMHDDVLLEKHQVLFNLAVRLAWSIFLELCQQGPRAIGVTVVTHHAGAADKCGVVVTGASLRVPAPAELEVKTFVHIGVFWRVSP